MVLTGVDADSETSLQVAQLLPFYPIVLISFVHQSESMKSL